MGRKKEINFAINTEQLRKLLINSGLTRELFAEKIGVTRRTLRNWEEQGGVSYGNYEKIKAVYGKYISNKPLKQIQSGQGKPTPYNPTEVTATAQMAMADAISVNPDTVIRLPMMINAEQVVPVYGHSMKGYIDHGDHIAIRRVTDSNRIIFGEPYVVVTRSSSMRTVKFVNENKDDLDKLWLSPYNTEQFDSQCIEKSDILEMHIVLGKLKNFNI